MEQRDEEFLRALGGWDAAQLERLLDLRTDLGQPPPPDLVALAARASSPHSVSNALLLLDHGAWQVLEAACLLADDITTDRLATLLGTSADAVAGPVGRLAERALLIERRGGWAVAPGVDTHQALRMPARLGAPAAMRLHGLTVPELERIATRLGLARDGGKASLVARIGETIGDAAQLEKVLAKAPPGAADDLRRVAERGPGVQLPYVPGALDDRGPVGWLLNRALLLRRPEWYMAEVPREVALALRGGKAFTDFVPEAPPVVTAAVDTAPLEADAVARALRLVADIGVLLDTWDERPPKLLKDGGVGIRDVRRVAQATDRTERMAAVCIELAARAGLVGIDGDPAMGLPTAASDDWRGLPVAHRWEELVDAWLRLPSYLSLAGETGTNDKPIPPMLEYTAEPLAVVQRRMLLRQLAAVPPGRAPDLRSLHAAVEWAAPRLWERGPAMPAMLVGWSVSEAALLGLAVQGSLSTVGRLVADDRLSDALGALQGHAPVLSRTIVIQGDLTAVASGELEAPVRAELELLADVESKGAATVFRLSEASVRRAFDAGRSAQEIEDFLDAHAPKGVPQALRYLIGDVARRHGSLRVGHAVSYLRSDDAALLAEACRARKLASLHLHLVAPTVAVSTAPAAKLVDALRAAGFLPAQEDASGAVLAARRATPRARWSPAPAPLPPAARDVEEVRALAKRLVGAVVRAEPAPGAGAGPVRAGSQWPGQPALLPFGVGGDEGDEEDDDEDGELVELAELAAFEQELVRGLVRQLGGEFGGELDDDGTEDGDDDDDEPERPSAIVREEGEIVALLALAAEQEWLVRMSYLNSKGQEHQMTAILVTVLPSRVAVEVLPSYGTRTLVPSRIKWARVLTLAEEEALL
jgi:hypothetical protein